MRLIQVVEDKPYFVWQLYVQMMNFRDHGVEEEAVILVVGNELSNDMKQLQAWTKAKIYCYPDTRKSRTYIPSIRPHLLKKYFLEIEQPEVFFYHDQDIIFLKKPFLDELAAGDTNYVAANAASYLNSGYCNSFKKSVFPSMCDLVGISEDLVRENDRNCGGAQYVLKGIDHKFWEKMERDCERLYRYLMLFFETEERKIQMWTADMWAILWNLWAAGKKTEHHESINFCWPWDLRQNDYAIFHNSGIAGNNENNAKGQPQWFNKGKFSGDYSNNRMYPWGQRFDFVAGNSFQYLYIQYIYRISEMMGKL
jgi:hypothetical protein